MCNTPGESGRADKYAQLKPEGPIPAPAGAEGSHPRRGPRSARASQVAYRENATSLPELSACAGDQAAAAALPPGPSPLGSYLGRRASSSSRSTRSA